MARRRAPEQPPKPITDGDPWRAPAIQQAIEAKIDGSPELAARLDDYVNTLTGLGDYRQDKTLGGSMYGLDFTLRYISSVGAENRWRGSDLGASIVEKIPDEMTREGWEISIQPSDEDDEPETETKSSDDPKEDGFRSEEEAEPTKPKGALPDIDDEGAEISEAIDGILDQLGASEVILTALQYERAFGGGAILIGANDGMDSIAKPLDEKNITSVSFLNALQGGAEGEIVAWSYYRDPKAPKYGEPEIYMVRNIGVPVVEMGVPGQVSQAAAGNKPIEPVFWVHESRLLIFPGTAVSRRARIQMRGWGDSIFTRIDEVLAQYSQTWAGIANLMTDFKQDVLAIDGSAQKMAGGDKVSKGKQLTNRARVIQQTKSLARMLVIDRLSETFSREAVTVQGVSDVLQQFCLRLAAAADMPVALLFGQAPAGMNATGASDIRFFYDRVASRQRRVLVPRLKRLVRLILLSKEGPTAGVEPARWNVKPRSLYQLSALEEAQRRLTVAQTDLIYIDKQVLSPEEVAASAFGGSTYSSERTIDFDGRAAMVEGETNAQLAKEQVAAAATAEAAKTGQPAMAVGAPIDLTPSSQGAIIKVNEARAQLGLPALTTAEGALDPDGNLTIAEFGAKKAATIAAAAKAEEGTAPGDPPPQAAPPFGGGGFGKKPPAEEAPPVDPKIPPEE